jgi:gamma-glutamyltranspeptidase / glutathione hydrolase
MTHVAIAAPSPAAAVAADRVLGVGGGAVDAALAAAIAAMVTEPGVVAPGAGAFVTVWPQDDRPMVYDGYMAVPGLGGRHPNPVEREVSMAYGGGITTVVGPASIAVPGAWAGFGAAHEEHGAIEWSAVMAPSVELARRGTPLGATSALYLGYALESVFDADPAGSRALRRNGRPLQAGERIRVEGLAETLEHLAATGADDFYRGELARTLSRDLRSRGSHLSPEDLAAFTVERRTPLDISLDGWTLATNPAPAVGGAALAALLALAPDGTPTALIEAQRLVYGWRRSRGDVARDRTAAISALLATLPGDPVRSPSTAHVSAVGGGVACAITLSAGYGSGVIPSGTGLWMNNGLGEVELVGERSALRPGDRLNSNMAPTVGRHRDGRLLAIGSPGADRITSAIAQTLLGLVRGMSAAEAVTAPRVHVHIGEATVVAHEPGIEIPKVADTVSAYDDLHMYFGGVGLAIESPDGTVVSATDPRRNGATLVR